MMSLPAPRWYPGGSSPFFATRQTSFACCRRKASDRISHAALLPLCGVSGRVCSGWRVARTPAPAGRTRGSWPASGCSSPSPTQSHPQTWLADRIHRSRKINHTMIRDRSPVASFHARACGIPHSTRSAPVPPLLELLQRPLVLGVDDPHEEEPVRLQPAVGAAHPLLGGARDRGREAAEEGRVEGETGASGTLTGRLSTKEKRAAHLWRGSCAMCWSESWE